MEATNSNAVSEGTTLMADGAVETVDNKKSKYTACSYLRAVTARKFQDQIGWPPLRNLLEIIDKNQIVDCPVMREDVMAAEDIFGLNLGSLKGKTPRSASTPVDETVTAVPPTIMERCREIVLAVELMFINKVPMLVTISRNLKFGTVAISRTKARDRSSRGFVKQRISTTAVASP
jgi:hypothetical protein